MECNYKEGKCLSARIYYLDGSIYDGPMRDAECNGDGKLFYPDGSCYQGPFVNGKRHGIGKIISQDGSIREVRFEEDEEQT